MNKNRMEESNCSPAAANRKSTRKLNNKQKSSSTMKLDNVLGRVKELKSSIKTWETIVEDMKSKYENSITNQDTKISRMEKKLKTVRSKLKIGNNKIKTMESKLSGFAASKTSIAGQSLDVEKEPKRKKAKKTNHDELNVFEKSDQQQQLLQDKLQIPEETDREMVKGCRVLRGTKLKKLIVCCPRVHVSPELQWQLEDDVDAHFGTLGQEKNVNQDCDNAYDKTIEVLDHGENGVNSTNEAPVQVENETRTEGQPPLQCTICRKEYYNPAALSRHIERCTKQKELKCPVCDELIRGKKKLKKHLKLHPEPSAVENTLSPDSRFECAVCHVNLSTQDEFDAHQKSHTVNLDNDTTVTGQGEFTCPKCHQSLKNNGAYCRHTKVCLGELQCPTCQKKFTRLHGLQQHLKSHAKVTLFKCSSCDKNYTRKDYLVRHQRRVHSSKRRYFECVPCQIKITNIRKHYKCQKHMNAINQLIISHECPVCSRKFNSASSVYLHLRVHTKSKENAEYSPGTFIVPN